MRQRGAYDPVPASRREAEEAEAASNALAQAATAPSWSFSATLKFTGVFGTVMTVIFFLVLAERNRLADYDRYDDLAVPNAQTYVLGQDDDAIGWMDVHKLYHMPTPPEGADGGTVSVEVKTFHVGAEPTYVTPDASGVATSDRLLTTTTVGTTVTVEIGKTALAPTSGDAIAWDASLGAYNKRSLNERVTKFVATAFAGGGGLSTPLTLATNGAVATDRMMFDGTSWGPGTPVAGGFASGSPVFKGVGTGAGPLTFDLSTVQTGQTMVYIGGGKWSWEYPVQLAGKHTTTTACATLRTEIDTMTRTEGGGRLFIDSMGTTATAAQGSSQTPCIDPEPHFQLHNSGKRTIYTDGVMPVGAQGGQAVMHTGADTAYSFWMQDFNVRHSSSTDSMLLWDWTSGTTGGDKNVYHVGQGDQSITRQSTTFSSYAALYYACTLRQYGRAGNMACEDCMWGSSASTSTFSIFPWTYHCSTSNTQTQHSTVIDGFHAQSQYGLSGRFYVKGEYGDSIFSDSSISARRQSAAPFTGTYRPSFFVQGLTMSESETLANGYITRNAPQSSLLSRHGGMTSGVAYYSRQTMSTTAVHTSGGTLNLGLVAVYGGQTTPTTSYGFNYACDSDSYNFYSGVMADTPDPANSYDMRMSMTDYTYHPALIAGSGTVLQHPVTGDGSCSANRCATLAGFCCGCYAQGHDLYAYRKTYGTGLANVFFRENTANLEVGHGDVCCENSAISLRTQSGHFGMYATVLPGYTGTIRHSSRHTASPRIRQTVFGNYFTDVIAFPAIISTDPPTPPTTSPLYRRNFCVRGAANVFRQNTGSC